MIQIRSATQDSQQPGAKLRRLQKAVLQKGQLRTTAFDEESQREHIAPFLAQEAKEGTPGSFVFDPFNGNGRRVFVPSERSQSRMDSRISEDSPWPDVDAVQRASRTPWGGISFPQYGTPPVYLPYSLREFLFRSGLRDGGDQYDKIVDDNATTHEADRQQAFLRTGANKTAIDLGWTEEQLASRKREDFEDTLKRQAKTVHPDDDESQKTWVATRLKKYDEEQQAKYGRIKRRPSYVFAPGVYEELLQHLNTTGDAFTPEEGKDSPDKTPKETSAYMVGSHMIDPESGTPWVLVHKLWKLPEGYSDTGSAFTATGEMLNDLQGHFKEHPYDYIVGHAHAHPPGSEALPSKGDLGHYENFVGNHGLILIHGTNAIRDHEGNILTGEAAKKYLEQNAMWGKFPTPKSSDSSVPLGQLKRVKYTSHVPYGSGTATRSYAPEVTSVIGAEGSVTNAMAYNTNGDLQPVTHAFYGRTRLPTPSNITILSAGRGGVQVRTPETYGLGSLPSPSTAQGKKIAERIAAERAQGGVTVPIAPRAEVATPPVKLGFDNPFPLDLGGRGNVPSGPQVAYTKTGVKEFYDPPKGSRYTGFGSASQIQEKSLVRHSLQRLKKAILRKGQLRTTGFEDEIQRDHIRPWLGYEVPQSEWHNNEPENRARSGLQVRFAPFGDRGARQYQITGLSQGRLARRYTPGGSVWPRPSWQEPVIWPDHTRPPHETNASSDGHPFDPPMILPYSLREFLFRSGLRDGGDQYERIVDDNTALHEMDHQHRLQKDRRTPYEWPRGVDEEDERKRILFEKTKEDILQQMRTMVDPEYAGVADALRSARQGNKKTSQFADWEDFPPHIQRIADAQIKDAYDSIYRPDYRNTRRRPAYVFAPGIYEDLIAHLNKTSDAFVSPDGKKKPTNTPVEQSAHLIGTHLIDPESGVPWILVHKLWKSPEGFGDNRTSYLLTGNMANDLREYFEENPHAYVVGHAHSHPPGSEPMPSLGDLSNYVGDLTIIHGTNAIRDADGNILSGKDAEAYLKQYGKDGRFIYPRSGNGPTLPARRLRSLPYDQPNNLLSYRRIIENALGSGTRTNIFSSSLMQHLPLTHGFFGKTRFETPANVTILSSTPSTGSSRTPESYGTTVLPTPTNSASAEIIDRIAQERARGGVEIPKPNVGGVAVPPAAFVNNRRYVDIGNRYARRSASGLAGSAVAVYGKDSEGQRRPRMTAFVPPSEYGDIMERSFSLKDYQRLQKSVLRKGQLRTTSYEDEIAKPNSDISEMLAAPVEGEDKTKGGRVFTYRGKKYRMTKKGKKLHDDLTFGNYKDTSEDMYDAFENEDDDDEWDSYDPDWDKPLGKESIPPQMGVPPAVIPYSLRQYLRENGFADRDGHYEKIVDDNRAQHAADHGVDNPRDYSATPRRPAFLLGPGVYDQLLAKLNKTGEVFGQKGSSTPIEHSGFLVGTKHIDPESGTPWITVDHVHEVPDEYGSTDSASLRGIATINDLAEHFKKHPYQFIVGGAHAHPPGNEAMPSQSDLDTYFRHFVHDEDPETMTPFYGSPTDGNPNALFMIHQPSAFHTKEGKLVYGPEAAEYLRQHALRASTGSLPPSPRIGRKLSSYDANPEDEALLGYTDVRAPEGISAGSATNFFQMLSRRRVVPVTHSALEGSRSIISHPNNITVIGKHGGPAQLQNATVRPTYPVDIAQNALVAGATRTPRRAPTMYGPTAAAQYLPRRTAFANGESGDIEENPWSPSRGTHEEEKKASFAQANMARLEKALAKTIQNIGTTEILQKGQLRTTSYKDEITLPGRGVREILARPATAKDKTGVFTYKGKQWVLTPTGQNIHEGLSRGQWPTDDDEGYDGEVDGYGYGYEGDDDEEEYYGDEMGQEQESPPIMGVPAAVIPLSLRQWLKSNGFSANEGDPNSYYDKVVDDNSTAHAFDHGSWERQPKGKKHTGDTYASTPRRPAFFFAPGVYERAIHHLNEKTADVFGPGKDKTPVEATAWFLGTKHIDPESGVPWVVVSDIYTNPYGGKADTFSNREDPKEMMNDLAPTFAQNPHMYVCGNIHSHPPGSTAAPSTGSGDEGWLQHMFDIPSDYSYGNPNAIYMVHSTNTLRVPGVGFPSEPEGGNPSAPSRSAGNFLHGSQASDYLQQNAFQRRDDPNMQWYDEGDVSPYGEEDSQDALLTGYKVPETKIIGGQQSATNAFHIIAAGKQGKQIHGATHGFIPGTRSKVEFPHQVTIMSSNGGPKDSPAPIISPPHPVNTTVLQDLASARGDFTEEGYRQFVGPNAIGKQAPRQTLFNLSGDIEEKSLQKEFAKFNRLQKALFGV